MRFVAVLLLVAIAVEAEDEGDFCNVNGYDGVCTNIKECPSAREGIRHNIHPKHCGYSGSDPVVCCVSSTAPRRPAQTGRAPGTSTTEYIPAANDYEDSGLDSRIGVQCPPVHPSLTSKPTGQKAWDKCLEYQRKYVFPCGKSQSLLGGLSRTNRCHHNADELILGGTAASPNEFPHMVLLGYGDDPDNLQWLCGGSLISERLVLTAGHCTASKDGFDVSYVQVGTLRRSLMRLKDRYRVRSIIKHPRYESPIQYHDIALLELERPIPLDETTVPACVYTGGSVDDLRASVTGWGLTTYGGGANTSDTLQKVVLNKFGVLECAVVYKPNQRLLMNGFDAKTQLCYGDRSLMSKDTCQGDSGGPLQIKNKQIACMYTIMGITSFGDKCGQPGVPAIYTRVLHYLDWIEKIVWP